VEILKFVEYQTSAEVLELPLGQSKYTPTPMIAGPRTGHQDQMDLFPFLLRMILV
jgi:hypothetical protein